MTWLRILLMIGLPLALVAAGGAAMSSWSHRDEVTRQLALVAPDDDTPLNRRFGYDAVAVDRHWAALDASAREHERVFLLLDLIFPFLYGGAFAASLLIGWASLGRPFRPALLLGLVLVMVLADWGENLIQLDQLGRYASDGGSALQDGWIRLASAATMVKWLGVAGSTITLLWLAAVMAARALRGA